MSPTKLLIGQVLMVFAIMALGVWAATQWAAAMLGYQPELGPAWFEVRGLPVYRPWALFPWWSTIVFAGAIMWSPAVRCWRAQDGRTAPAGGPDRSRRRRKA
jgi:type IV secretory pathway TraG/TraD family ATPase VirD4